MLALRRIALLIGPSVATACAGGNAATPAAKPSCYRAEQVQAVIGDHQRALRQTCWEHDPTSMPNVLVTVSMTIGRDGIPEEVESSGDDGSTASCVRNDVYAWRFPVQGCEQKVTFAFHFVRQ